MGILNNVIHKEGNKMAKITARQKSARRINIAIARAAREDAKQDRILKKIKKRSEIHTKILGRWTSGRKI
jgi:hypothetical protein